MAEEGASALLTILEYLIVHLQHEKEEQSEGFSTLSRTLVISLDIKDSCQNENQSYFAAIISATGDLSHKCLLDQIRQEIEELFPWCQNKALNGKGCPHESLPIMPFQLSLELREKSDVIKEACLTVKQFIYRTSLMHTEITFHYCVNRNGLISSETYNTERQPSISLPNGITLPKHGTHFVRRTVSWDLISSCDKIHPVTGKSVGLLIPDEVAERGFGGELRLVPVVALFPCQKSFPKAATRISAVSIFLYDPAGLPVLFPKTGPSCCFFNDPSSLAAWEKYGYQATVSADSEPCEEEDTAKPDVRYKLHACHKQDLDVQEQTLLLFLILTYSNQFDDKAAYNFWDRRLILSHLSPILLCNEQAVKTIIRETVTGVLEECFKMTQEQQKLTASFHIMADAISSIVSSSTSSDFRRKCLRTLQVADTQELQVTIRDTFNKVVRKRWKPSSACESRKVLPENSKLMVQHPRIDLASCAVPQEALGSYVTFEGMQGKGKDSFKGLLQTETKTKMSWSRELPAEDSDANDSRPAKRKSLFMQSNASSSPFFLGLGKEKGADSQDRNQGGSAASSVSRAKAHENLGQGDLRWNQEGSLTFGQADARE